MLSTEQKLLAALSHGGVFLAAPILIPLVVMLISSNDYVKTQAKEALIFQLGLIAAAVISGVLVILLVGIFGLIFVGIVTVIMPIVAIINVLEGKDYSYPITGKFARGI
jgi:uncharacterized Tic20 family protein